MRQLSDEFIGECWLKSRARVWRNRTTCPSELSRRSTLYAIEHLPNEGGAPGFRRHPGPYLPGWIVPHMLRVATFQIRDPVVLRILMKADDAARTR